MADVLDARFDAAFVFWVADRCGGGLEEVMAGEMQKTWIELDHVADVGQNDAFEIVVDDSAWDAAEELQGSAMHAAESLHLLVEGEIHEVGARPRHHHGKRRNRALCIADAHVPE